MAEPSWPWLFGAGVEVGAGARARAMARAGMEAGTGQREDQESQRCVPIGTWLSEPCVVLSSPQVS